MSSSMSLSRAFTTRRVRASTELAESKMPQRSITHKGSTPHSLRNKISGPVELVHTTNMLSYNAPDIPRSGRSNSTSKSDTDSDSHSASDSTPPTSPDASVTDEYPSPQPNHLSTYFIAPGKPLSRDLTPEPVPAIPRRSPSHTKKNSYDAIARQRSISQQRSMSQMSRDSDRTVSTKHSLTFSRSSSTSTRASSASHSSAQQAAIKTAPPPPMPVVSPLASPQLLQTKNPPPPPRSVPEPHPFGAELAQVTELAEEFSASSKGGPYIMDEDDQYLHSHGLMKLNFDDYMNDVQELFDVFYQQPPKRAPRVHVPIPAGPAWI